MTVAMVPAPQVDLMAALIALLPVLAGGLVAIVAAAIGPVLTNLFEAKTSRRQQRLARFEELVTNFYGYEMWVEARRLQYQWGEARPSIVSPLNRTATLAALHFPTLEAGLEKLHLLEKQYNLWMSQAGNRRLSGQIDKVNDGFDEAYRPWYGQFSQVEKSIHELGRTIERGKS